MPSRRSWTTASPRARSREYPGGIWTPSTVEPRDLPQSRKNETAADHFSVLFGARGGVAKAPGAIPLFDYYMFVTRPNFVEKQPNEIDWRTHPLDADRFNASQAQLEGYGIQNGLASVGPKLISLKPEPPKDPPQLWLPPSMRKPSSPQGPVQISLPPGVKRPQPAVAPTTAQ